MKVIPYVSFNGQCAEAFKFYAAALGGKIEMMMTYGESPMAGQTPPEMKDHIMHAALSHGDAMIMGGDAPPSMFKPAQGLRINISVDAESDAEEVFGKLGEGGRIEMPLAETFWAKRFGMVTDRFGTPWMVNCSKPM